MTPLYALLLAFLLGLSAAVLLCKLADRRRDLDRRDLHVCPFCGSFICVDLVARTCPLLSLLMVSSGGGVRAITAELSAPRPIRRRWPSAIGEAGGRDRSLSVWMHRLSVCVQFTPADIPPVGFLPGSMSDLRCLRPRVSYAREGYRLMGCHGGPYAGLNSKKGMVGPPPPF